MGDALPHHSTDSGTNVEETDRRIIHEQAHAGDPPARDVDALRSRGFASFDRIDFAVLQIAEGFIRKRDTGRPG
jgi:hypothetical protein